MDGPRAPSQPRRRGDIVAGQQCQDRAHHTHVSRMSAPAAISAAVRCDRPSYSVACWLKYCNNLRALLRKPVISGAISISPAANARHCADRESLCGGRYARLCDGTARKPRLLCGQGRRPRRLTDLLCHASTRGFGHSLLTALPRSATGMHILYYSWFYTGLLTMTVEC